MIRTYQSGTIAFFESHITNIWYREDLEFWQHFDTLMEMCQKYNYDFIGEVKEEYGNKSAVDVLIRFYETLLPNAPEIDWQSAFCKLLDDGSTINEIYFGEGFFMAPWELLKSTLTEVIALRTHFRNENEELVDEFTSFICGKTAEEYLKDIFPKCEEKFMQHEKDWDLSSETLDF